MIIKTSNFVSSRRQFLKGVLPTGTLFCFGCSNLLAMPFSKDKKKASTEKHKFLEDSGMTVEEVFQYAYRDNFVPYMQAIAKDIGDEKLITMLKKAASDNAVQMMRSMTKDLPKKDFAVFNDWVKNVLNAFPYKNALVYEIVKETDKEIKVKYTECLFAKTFREANAADIGYATQCHPSDAMIRAFNPKIRVDKPKNLMKGDEVCIEHFVWEG
jgi:hypothetical protein